MEEKVRAVLSDPMTGRLASAALALLIVFVVARLLLRSAEHYVKDNDARYRARKAVSFFRYAASGVALALIFTERLAGITVVFGVAGAGVAFALQEVIVSIAGWMAISSGGFYQTGDRVQVGGIKGDVIDIGVLRTTIMEVGEWVKADLYNGRIVKVANSFVFKEPVFNYSADFPFLWDEITVPIRYGSDWKAAKATLVGVGEEICGDYAKRSKDAWRAAVVKYRLEDAPVEPEVTMVANDNWLELTLRYVVDYRKRRAVKDLLFTRVLEEVDSSEGRIRLASTTFELVNLPRLEVDKSESRIAVVPRYVP